MGLMQTADSQNLGDICASLGTLQPQDFVSQLAALRLRYPGFNPVPIIPYGQIVASWFKSHVPAVGVQAQIAGPPVAPNRVQVVTSVAMTLSTAAAPAISQVNVVLLDLATPTLSWSLSIPAVGGSMASITQDFPFPLFMTPGNQAILTFGGALAGVFETVAMAGYLVQT